MYNPFSIKDKTIFITGASSGIGRATAIECSKMEARVIITGRNQKRLEDTFLKLHGNDHLAITADLTIQEELDNLISSLPKLDGVVCNAGKIEKKPIQFIDKESFESILDINTIVPVMMTHQLVKLKKMNNPSSIVYTSSIAGVYTSSIGNSMYSTSKGALNAFMKNAALDLAKKGIRCNSVNPGLTDTNLLNDANFTENQILDFKSKYPLKRVGMPDDIAHSIIFLISDASGWITGTALKIDGGFTLQ